MQLDFGLASELHFHIVLVDARFPHQSALLVKNYQAADSLPQCAATRRRHEEHELRVVATKADLHDIVRWGIRLPQARREHLVVRLKHGHYFTLLKLRLRRRFRVQIE